MAKTKVKKLPKNDTKRTLLFAAIVLFAGACVYLLIKTNAASRYPAVTANSPYKYIFDAVEGRQKLCVYYRDTTANSGGARSSGLFRFDFKSYDPSNNVYRNAVADSRRDNVASPVCKSIEMHPREQSGSITVSAYSGSLRIENITIKKEK